METYHHLYEKICSEQNLFLAYLKARKRKTTRDYVLKFEENLNDNLGLLREELLSKTYRPQPLRTFILRDPKTRKISVSEFRDRIVYHAVCRVIEPIFEKYFIHDSYANRKNKGTLAAINRLNAFIKKVTKNGTLVKKSFRPRVRGFYLKCDIKKYFDNVPHQKMLDVLSRIIIDKKLLFLIKTILGNYHSKSAGSGMPLGNLTSQFFANIYLNELDQFVKHKLKAKYYLRYVDDFVILSSNKPQLEHFLNEIKLFLKEHLDLELSPNKTMIFPISRGIDFIGFRHFYPHRLLGQKAIRKIYTKINGLYFEYQTFSSAKNYGLKQSCYDRLCESFQGWQAYAKLSEAYRLKRKIVKIIENQFSGEISTPEFYQLAKEMKNKKFSYFSTSSRPH